MKPLITVWCMVARSHIFIILSAQTSLTESHLHVPYSLTQVSAISRLKMQPNNFTMQPPPQPHLVSSLQLSGSAVPVDGRAAVGLAAYVRWLSDA